MKFGLMAVVMAAAAPVGAVTLDFDQFAGSSQISSDGGFDFSNFYALDTTGFYPSGYVNGTVSPSNIAYNGDGGRATVSSTTPFSLTYGYVTAAWNDGLTVTLTGTLAGAPVFTQSFVVGTAGPTLEAFNPALIDTVTFMTAGGTHHAGYNAGVGTQLALDNLTINGVLPTGGPVGGIPEPASWTMMLAGFGLVGSAVRRGVPNYRRV